jgi:hypothetical protein
MNSGSLLPIDTTAAAELFQLSAQIEIDPRWSDAWGRIRESPSNTPLWQEFFNQYLKNSASVSLWKIYLTYIRSIFLLHTEQTVKLMYLKDYKSPSSSG